MQLQKSMCDAMSNASDINRTLDLWTNRQMCSYLGVTAHFINSFQFISCMLSCKWFKGCHTAENIYSSYGGIIQLFGIERKVKYIVSDNASKLFLFPDLRSQQPVMHQWILIMIQIMKVMMIPLLMVTPLQIHL